MQTLNGPYADNCCNPGFDDYWTCPGCYADLRAENGFSEGDATCLKCGRELELTVETQPMCVATLKEGCGDAD